MPSLPDRIARFVGYADLTPGVASLTFESDGLDWLPGQYIEFVDPTVADTRCAFSIASMPTARAPGRFEIAAARGSSAEFLFALEPGAELSMTSPRGKFLFRSPAGIPVTFVGAGTGLAPLRAMLLDALERQGARSSVAPRFLMVFGGRSESDLLWSSELRALAADPAVLGYAPTLSQPGPSWNGPRGYVQTHLPELLAGRTAGDVYICGPDAMVRACVEVIAERVGIGAEHIFTEGH